jgi:murein L,D-transpeptidase YcbB/YkuD
MKGSSTRRHGWLPTAENIEALPAPIRDYIHRLQTNVDPAGDQATLMIERDRVRQLSAALAERDSRVLDGVALIAEERHRQVLAEGWTPEHDAEHVNGEMAISAARYALHDTPLRNRIAWQWESCWWKPKDPIRNLVRAGALIAAEIDRRLRKR